MALSAAKYNSTVQALARGGASGTGLLLNADTLKMGLCTNATVPAAADTTFPGTGTQVANGNGYATGGVSLTGATAQNPAGTEVLKTTTNFASPTWTASGAGFTVQYFIWYDSTAAASPCYLLARWDYGSALTLSGANADTLDISGSNFNSATPGWGTLV